MKYSTYVLLLALLAGSIISQVPVAKKPKAKAGVKMSLGGKAKLSTKSKAKLGMKMKVGGKATTKVAAKPKTGKLSIKLGAKASAKPKTGKLSIKLGGKASAKPKTGKVTLRIKGKTAAAAKPAVMGKCPQATAFGMVAGAVRTFSKGAAKMCPDMTSACCTVSSMTNWRTTFQKGAMKKISSMFWSISRTVPVVGKLIGNLNATLVSGAAKLPKRRLQKMKKRSPKKAKASVRVRAKVPKVKAGLKLRVKSGVKRTGGVRVRTGGVRVKTGVRSSGLKLRIGSSSSRVRTTGKTTIRLRVRSKASSTPSTFLVGTVARTAFRSTWSTLLAVSKQRKAIRLSAKKCFRSIASLKTRMACLACDNTQYDMVKSGIKLTDASMKDVVTNCAQFFYWVPKIQGLVTSVADLVLTLKANAAVSAALTAVRAKVMPSSASCWAGYTDVAWTSITDKRSVCSSKKAKVTIRVKVPKVSIKIPKVSIKAKATVPKVSLKVKKVAAPKAKVALKVKAAPKAKVALKVKAGAKRILQALKVKAKKPVMKVKTGVKAKVGVKTGVKARVGVKTGVKARVGVKTGVKARVGVKTGVKARVGVKVPTLKIRTGVKVPTVRIGGKVTVRKAATPAVPLIPGMENWRNWNLKQNQCGEANKQRVPTVLSTTACFKSSKFFQDWVGAVVKGKSGSSAKPMRVAMETLLPMYKLIAALMTTGNSRVQMMWKRFQGPRFSFLVGGAKRTTKKVKVTLRAGAKIGGSMKLRIGGAKKTTKKVKLSLKGKKVAAPKVKLSVKAKKVAAPKVKLSVKAKKNRRMQAAAKPATAAPATAAPATASSTISTGTTGAKLPVSGITIPEDVAGDGQDAAGSILKGFATLCIAMMFIN